MRRPRSAASIPGLVTQIRYRRTGPGVPRDEQGEYYHDFTTPVRMRAQRDGSVRLVGRHRIHADDHEPGFGRYLRASERHAMRNARRSSSGDWGDLLGYAVVGVVGWFLYRQMTSGGGSLGLPGASPGASPGAPSSAFVPQPAGTVWISDPAQGGTGQLFVGTLPPNAAAGWREASELEIAASGILPQGATAIPDLTLSTLLGGGAVPAITG
jgi:hypothetical protein